MTDRRFGDPVPRWVGPPRPDAPILQGRYVRLERLTESHAHALFRANAEDEAIWDYLPYGPFASEVGYM
ncbi:MAG TPA: GNAT family N-acetyltransferase, partial [Paenirhodobacter sp.]